jgi:type IV secretion system protein VirB6
MIGDGMLIALAALIVYVATALMFAVWIVAQALLALLLTIGPLIILALLFDYMRGWFDRWIAAMLLMVLVTMTADLISAVVLKVIFGAMNALPITGQATQDTLNLLGVAMVVVVLAGALALLPAVLQFLAAAAGAPAMNHAQRLLSAAVYRPAASIATGSLRRVAK